jgi:hypothetical protein
MKTLLSEPATRAGLMKAAVSFAGPEWPAAMRPGSPSRGAVAGYGWREAANEASDGEGASLFVATR